MIGTVKQQESPCQNKTGLAEERQCKIFITFYSQQLL